MVDFTKDYENYKFLDQRYYGYEHETLYFKIKDELRLPYILSVHALKIPLKEEINKLLINKDYNYVSVDIDNLEYKKYNISNAEIKFSLIEGDSKYKKEYSSDITIPIIQNSNYTNYFDIINNICDSLIKNPNKNNLIKNLDNLLEIMDKNSFYT